MLLNVHTYFSLGYGTLSPEEVLKACTEYGYKKILITDINTTTATIDTLRLRAEYNIEVSMGIDFRNDIEQLFVGIPKCNLGFQQLNEYLSEYLHEQKPFPAEAPDIEHCFFIYPLEKYGGQELKANEYIGINSKQIASLHLSLAKHQIEKCVILQPLSFIDKSHFNAHRLLRAIHYNILLSKLEPQQQTSPDETILNANELEKQFEIYPSIIENTRHILSSSQLHFEYGKMSNKNKSFYTTSTKEDIQLLRKLSYDGIRYRYSVKNKTIIERLEKELSIIEQMNFAAYFLINWDIVMYARSKNYFYVGRGSGANSMVAYLLRITDVDPIDLDLYFERFINPYRNNPPDFDIDFSWTDRDDITDYIFKRFGTSHTALLATYSTFQHDAVIRELGKVFGLPSFEIERIQHSTNYNELDSMSKLVVQYAQLIGGMPSHLSIHSSGIIISELPISAYTATFMPPKGYPTTQFSMIEAEDIGLAKFDILSQRGLGKIKEAVDIIKQNKNVNIDIHDIPKFKNDELVKKLLSEGKCIGCFYIESPAMRMLLTKLQADDYLRLVAASSIIRPGVSKSGMMNEYIVRYRDVNKRKAAQEAIPELYDLLEETYGVMVYQEDVIKVAHRFADLSLAEADYLRRGMSWKFKQRNEFHKVKENFFSNCLKKGYAIKTIEDIWNQIESFANYAFSKAHSASYAVESFQALYLKAYYPLEYMVATLNNGGGFYKTEFYVHEARMQGATIMPPCINHSDVVCSIEGSTIYLGFQMVAELTKHSIEAILNHRNLDGPYTGLYDFIHRTQLSLDQITLLIRVGAFSLFNRNKKELLWQAHLYVNPKKKNTAQELFFTPPKEYTLPVLQHTTIDDALDEIELLGFPLCSPFLLLKQAPTIKNLAKDLAACINKKVSIVGYLVAVKRTATHNGKRMNFGTFIDQEGAWIDTVHFPPSAAAYPFRGPGCYLISGTVVSEFDFLYIDVEKQERLASINRMDL